MEHRLSLCEDDFILELNRLYDLRRSRLSKFSEGVSRSLFRTFMAALDDHATRTKRLQVSSAPKGSGKSSSAMAFLSYALKAGGIRRIAISVLLGNSGETLARVLALEANVAILAHVVDDPRVHTVPFSTHEVVVFVNSDHPWYGREGIGIGELAGQPLILRERGSTTRRAFEIATQKAGVTITPLLEIGSREGVWKAVERGLGIGVVADFEFVEHPNLKTVPITDADVHTEYRLACLMERRNSPKIWAFIDTVVAPDPAPRQ